MPPSWVFLEKPVDIDMTPLDVQDVLNHLTDMSHLIHLVLVGFYDDVGRWVIYIWWVHNGRESGR